MRHYDQPTIIILNNTRRNVKTLNQIRNSARYLCARLMDYMARLALWLLKKTGL